jgi:MarR family transcriptional regulator, organic hydroperoxide resistance regulator
MSRHTPAELHSNQRNAERLMKRIMTHFQTVLDEELRPHGATIAQVRLLWAIRNAPGSSGAQLSRECDVTPQTTQALIQRAEEAGWIVRGKDRINERIVTATLTSTGDHLLQAADRIVRGIEAKLWKGIRPEAIEDLIDVLEQCLQNVHPERVKQ